MLTYEGEAGFSVSLLTQWIAVGQTTDKFIIHDNLERVCTFSYTQSYVSLAYDSVVRIVHTAQFPRFSGLSLPLKWKESWSRLVTVFDTRIIRFKSTYTKTFFPNHSIVALECSMTFSPTRAKETFTNSNAWRLRDWIWSTIPGR